MKKKLLYISLAIASLSTIVVISKPAIAGVTDCHTTAASDDYKRFPFGFFCPRNDSSNFTQVQLNNSTDTPRGRYEGTRTIADSEYLAPGQTLKFTTGYDKAGNVRTSPPDESDSQPNSTYYPDNDSDATNNFVYVWTIVDGNNSVIDSVSGSAPTAVGALATRSCPTVDGYDGIKHFVNNSTNTGTSAGWTGYWGWPSNDPNRSPFASSDLDGSVSCADEGKMIVWRLTAAEANSIGTSSLGFQVKLKDNLPYSVDKPVCLRTMVSVRYNTGTDSEDPFDAAKLSHIAAKSKFRCYRISSTRVEGTIRSSENNATGKLLPGVAVYYDRNCNGAADEPLKVQFTDANGKYVFSSFRGELYCVYVRGSTSAPPPTDTEVQASEGTSYHEPEGLYRGLGIASRAGITWQVSGVGCGVDAQGTNNTSDNYYVNCFGRTQDMTVGNETESDQPDATNVHGHDFKYNPIATAPGIEKISYAEGVDQSTAQTLRPGEVVSFDVIVTNKVDANQNVNIRDYIPLNMVADMQEIKLDCVEIDPIDENRPSTWFVYDSSSDCREEGNTLIPNAPNYFEFGNDESELFTYFNEPFYYREVPGSGSNAPYIGFDVRRMPAYSQITFEWSGKVKPKEQIGVYPGYTAAENSGDHRYCASPNGGTYNNTTSILSECEDTVNGYQGVANFVVTTADGSITPRNSNITYNAIPGEISNFQKEIDGATTFGGGPAYNIEYPAYNWATFRSEVTVNQDLGPVRYTVIDQTDGSNSGYGSSQLDRAIATVDNVQPSSYTTGSGNANSLGSLTWAEQNSFQPGAQSTFSFYSTFDGDRPIGDSAINNAKVCWTEYWNNPHSVNCRNSSASIKRIRQEEPNVAVDYGAVTGGGNISIRDNGAKCDVVDGSRGGLVGNPGSYGMYMLSVKNQTTYNAFTSKSGFGVSSTTPADGLSCRPDIAKEARNYANFTTLPSNTISGAPSGYANKVVKGSGDVFINNLTVNGRWTIFVEGRVYIKGDITRGGVGALALGASDSLGIVATDGIYISKDVSRVDALLYAGGYNQVSNTYATGVIDTCADESNRLQARNSTPGYYAANCRERNLTVNGIMYARTLRLNRTKVSVTDYADKIMLGGQTYLMMPPAFNALTQKGNSGSIREQRPRF